MKLKSNRNLTPEEGSTRVRGIHLKLFNGTSASIIDTPTRKILISKAPYNFVFEKKTGLFMRWGNTTKEDGDLWLGMPELADIEISTICHGIDGKPCSFCYKANSGTGINMSLETFKKVFAKLPPSISQIAFGIGDIDSNPDMFDIFQYVRDNGVIPNVTINGWNLTDEYAVRLANVLGAIAISNYDYDLCADAVKKMTDAGMTQCNIHNFLSQESLPATWKLLKNVKSDPRLAKLNAIVMLSLKKQGRAKTGFNPVSDADFAEIIIYAMNNNIGIGFDSCTGPKFMRILKSIPPESFTTPIDFDKISQYVEPCESSLYSVYIDATGHFSPCSFVEGTPGWEEGLDVVNCKSFLKDIWWNEKTLAFKTKVIKCRECTGCPVFEI